MIFYVEGWNVDVLPPSNLIEIPGLKLKPTVMRSFPIRAMFIFIWLAQTAYVLTCPLPSEYDYLPDVCSCPQTGGDIQSCGCGETLCGDDGCCCCWNKYPAGFF